LRRDETRREPSGNWRVPRDVCFEMLRLYKLESWALLARRLVASEMSVIDDLPGRVFYLQDAAAHMCGSINKLL